MKKTGNQSREADTDSATNKLMIAHNEIISTWFEHWANQERSRIGLAFKNPTRSETTDKLPDFARVRHGRFA